MSRPGTHVVEEDFFGHGAGGVDSSDWKGSAGIVVLMYNFVLGTAAPAPGGMMTLSVEESGAPG